MKKKLNLGSGGIKGLILNHIEKAVLGIVVALGVGLLLSFLAKLGQMFPGVGSWGLVVISGLLVAMTAMGFYDTAHKANQARKAQKK